MVRSIDKKRINYVFTDETEVIDDETDIDIEYIRLILIIILSE